MRLVIGLWLVGVEEPKGDEVVGVGAPLARITAEHSRAHDDDSSTRYVITPYGRRVISNAPKQRLGVQSRVYARTHARTHARIVNGK